MQHLLEFLGVLLVANVQDVLPDLHQLGHVILLEKLLELGVNEILEGLPRQPPLRLTSILLLEIHDIGTALRGKSPRARLNQLLGS